MMPIPSPDLEFDRVAPYISDALEYAGGTHTLEDVRQAVRHGKLQLWPGVHSAVLTEILDTPRQRELHFFLAGGNLDEIKSGYPHVLSWARSVGCTRATFVGRPGWLRTFLTREEGWTAPTINMQKDLTNG